MTLDGHTSDPEIPDGFSAMLTRKGSSDTGAAGQAGRSAVKTEDL